MFKRMFILVVLVVSLALLAACSEPAPEGEYTQYDIEDSYDEGWNQSVNDVFYEHDVLYYANEQYERDNFISNYLEVPFFEESYPDSSYPYDQDDLDEAFEQGRLDCLDYIFLETDVLSYGLDRYRKDNFL